MSVSYFLVHRQSQARYEQGERGLLSLGSLESIRNRIDALHSGIVWRFELGHWCGIHENVDPRYYYEIAMTPDANGNTDVVHVDRAYREFAIDLARGLDLAVFDPQDGDFIVL